MKSKDIYLFIFIFLAMILVGIFLRFNYLEHTPFQSHIIADLEVANAIAEGEEFRLVGVTSNREVDGQQQTFGPLSYYLFALPLMFTKSPITVVGLVALFSTLSFVLCFKFGKEFFGEKAGLLAASFYAVNPWAVFFSNVITSTFLMPFFILIFVYSLFKLVIRNKDHYVILCLISLATLLQLHLSSLWLVFVMLISLFLFKRKINLKYLTVGLLVAFLFFVPFVYHNLTNPNTGSILGHMTDRPTGTVASNIVETIGTPFVIAGTYFGKYFFGQDYIFNSLFADRLFLAATVATSICILVGLMLILYNGLKKIKKEYILLFIWFVVPILSYLFLFRKNISPHFYIILFPAQFLILGILLSHSYNKNKILTITTIFIMLAASIIYSIGFFNYLDEMGGSTAIYKLTYKTKSEVVDFILEDSGSLNPAIHHSGGRFDRSYNYIFELRGAHPVYAELPNYENLYNVKGYFISERYWRKYWFNEDLPYEGNKILDNLDKVNIHNVEVFILPGKEQANQ